jgi:hypothetical protein
VEAHKKKADWHALVEAGNLGDDRLLLELEKLLNATITRYFKDLPVGEHPDNGVRMGAVALLARLLGRDKAELTIHGDLIQVIPAPKPDEQPPDDD